MKKDIIVIGGYGHVGGQICKLLAARYPGNVFAAGRSLERAEQFCASTGGKVRPLQLNLGDPFPAERLERVKLVVMCLDQENPSFVITCLNSGTHYVDVSANGAFLTQLEALNTTESGLKGSAVISVGLAPGLTNLLAREAKLAMDQTQRIEISIMLGLGDSHGQAAIEWTVDNLSATYDITQKGSRIPVNSFTAGRKTDFGGRLGQRKAFRFPFSDQQTLPGSLDVSSVATRLCFDSRFSTAALAFMQKLGLMPLLRGRMMRKLAVKSFGKLRFGSDMFAVKVDAYGQKDGAPALSEWSIQGSEEARITAMTAAAVALAVYESASLPSGVFHLEQLFGVKLGQDNLTLTTNHTAGPFMEQTLPDISGWSRLSKL
ncbi:hypothetical protein GCM10010912_12170 [Paenibacillus albidus]|uniref:Saccharopine dehydrogenase NADP binding domain-containing protein n=1 Tax=Paenibacillus albidus TaxID=2041023 RepID=A0A917C254_9BACL|nr:saccharopine dehydrogenase NADP-binding domain-containing protein [Paenibacillus albidus]GGF68676.1 hypothetical protein GCM10010912_12170 [Paenibacillus albidus]